MIRSWEQANRYCSDYALLVQLVERRSPKPDVGGSSPPGRAESPNIKFCPKAPGLLAGNSQNRKLSGRINFCGRFAKNAINKCSVWLLDHRFRRSAFTPLIGWACKKVVALDLRFGTWA